MQWYAAILGLLLCSLLACSASVTPHGPYVEVSRSAVIVVGGYYGTKLSRVDNGELLWVTASQVFGGAQSLILPLPDLAFHGVALQPSGILDEVRVIPWLYSFEVYRPLLAELGRLYGGRVSISPLNYDWRLDLMDAVRLLSAEIRRLKSQGITHIALVAHSMGGLIVSYDLRYGDQELEQAVETWEGTVYVEKVVMAGVPFLGSMWSFRNMQYGRKIGFNSSLLDQQALASFPASYYTLPALGADVLLTPTQHLVRGAIHMTAHWRQQGWGLLKGTPVLLLRLSSVVMPILLTGSIDRNDFSICFTLPVRRRTTDRFLCSISMRTGSARSPGECGYRRKPDLTEPMWCSTRINSKSVFPT